MTQNMKIQEMTNRTNENICYDWMGLLIVGCGCVTLWWGFLFVFYTEHVNGICEWFVFINLNSIIRIL